ncbi:hypothetical protein FACS1894110_15370 [Spirochaetia bacterium]|nr:hypothetical protein FACS1894110_15370 [Spirochaetia bacterium]
MEFMPRKRVTNSMDTPRRLYPQRARYKPRLQGGGICKRGSGFLNGPIDATRYI